MRLPIRVLFSTLGLCACFLHSPAAGADFFLTIGGGPRPDNNQVSLERNVLFHRGVLAERRPDGPPHELFFADGLSEARDLQYRLPECAATCPTARRILAEVLGDAASMELRYRSHTLTDLAGPSDPQLLRRRLRDLAKQLKPGDRLFLYVTAHGGPAKKPAENSKAVDKDKAADTDKTGTKDRPLDAQAYNTSLYCWSNTTILASEFADWLDQLDPKVNVMLVMVQ